MIFLFCNKTYGARFAERMISFSKERNIALTIVSSAKRRADYSRFGRFFVKFKSLIYCISMKIYYKFKHGVNFVYTDNVNKESFVRFVRSEDVGLISGFNQIFHAEIIGRFRHFVNFHPSLLPYYKGPVPSLWCVANGERFSGFSIHEVTTKVDSGKILYQDVVTIDNDDEQSLDLKIAEIASTIMVEYLDHLFSGKDFRHNIVNADTYYKNKVDYAGFA